MDVLDAPRRKKLAQAAGFENLLSATVLDLREADGVMRVRLGESACEIEVPLGYAAAGNRVQVAVRAGDILLATERPHGLSGAKPDRRSYRVAGAARDHGHCARGLRCRVRCARYARAVRALELSAGHRVWLVLKTHSCHLVE